MRRIVITSGKGGVGKTTLTAGLGRCLARGGFRVVLVDGDVGLNNLDVVVGVDSRVVYDIADVLAGKCRLSQAYVQDPESSMRVLPSSSENSLITAQAFRGLVDSMTDFDFVIIDCPAGIERGFHRSVSAADEAIIVTTLAPSAIRDADKVAALLRSYKLADVSLVVNRVRGDMVAKGEMLHPLEAAKLLHTPIIGAVPEDDNITLYQQLGRIPELAPSERSYISIAENLLAGTKTFEEQYTRRRLFGFRR
jgi:septum site-determining protein MinD